MKSKTTAAVLAFFLGGLGIHRFYLGQTGLGILYLIFCWTFIPAIIALIDFIVLLSMSEQGFNAKYNQKPGLILSTSLNTADELEKLHSLKERGILSETEYQAKKSKLL